MKKLKFRDYLAIVLLILISIFTVMVYFIKLQYSTKGEYVSVYVDGKIRYSVSLSTNTTLEIDTGNGINTLVIKDGEAYIESADCSGQDCVNHVPISRVGEQIVCIPHKLIIMIEEGS